MDGGMNDSENVVEVNKCNDDITIDINNLKKDSPCDDFLKTGEKSETSRNDDSSQHSSIMVNENSNFLVKVDEKKEEKSKKKKNCCLRGITSFLRMISNIYEEHKAVIHRILLVAFIVLNLIWLIVACVKDIGRSVPFLIIWCIAVLSVLYSNFRTRYGSQIMKSLQSSLEGVEKYSQFGKWIALVLAVILFSAWMVFDTSKRPYQLISLAGYLIFLFVLFILSKKPDQVKWRPVIWGCSIQVCLGLFILRTSIGFTIFNFLGDFVQVFLGFVKSGCVFVFGTKYVDHYFAFGVLPIIIYFSAFISVLYHLGAMQKLISKIAWVMQVTLGTSATESMVAAGNIFVGQTESPLLIRPYLNDITTSEMHAVMTAGFGTISGSVLGAYLGFGIEAVYLITACVMAAPCALAISKLMYPETEVSKFTSDEGLVLESSSHHNVIEAAFVGASQAIPLVLNIGANLIAFIAMLAALNGFLGWYGSLVDIENLSFEYLCSFIFMPFSYLMGIEWADCFKCAELIGTKIFLNEFIAYEKLSFLIDNKANGTMHQYSEEGEIQWISDRSEAIITYALCGFANIGSLGIMLGGLGAMCPERQGEMSKIVVRALITGIFVGFLNACVAGFFYFPPEIDCEKIFSRPWHASEVGHIYQCCSQLLVMSSTQLNTTNSTQLNTTNYTPLNTTNYTPLNTTNSTPLISTNLTQMFDKCCDYTWPYSYDNIEGC